MNVRSLFLFAVLVFLAGAATGAEDDPAGISAALKQADRLFKEQNCAEARKQYGSLSTRLADRRAPAMRRAVEGEVACAVKLTRWDDAVGQLAAYIDHNLDTLNAVAKHLRTDKWVYVGV